MKRRMKICPTCLLSPQHTVVLWLEDRGVRSERWLYGGCLLLTMAAVILFSTLFFYAVEKPTILFARLAKKKIALWQKDLPDLSLPNA